MGYIDIHSHILPKMDDGSRSMEQSLEMLRIACKQGITVMIATPHNMPGKGCPSIKQIYEKVEWLQTMAEQEEIPMKLIAGTEYYYREEVLDMLEADEIMTLGDSSCVLVEFEPTVDRIYFRNALRDIMTTGHRPVIAHVERYINITQDILLLTDLKKMGALIQVNAASITGDYGRYTKKAVKQLLKEQMVDFVATDAHSDGRRAPFLEKCAATLYKKYDRNYADALLFENAKYFLLEETK